MADLKAACRLIRQALARRSSIWVVGDYDVDGLTGTALLVRLLTGLGGEVSWHIPHRMEDGYGLKEAVVRKAAEAGCGLLVSVDCGTTSFKELKLAKRLKMKTIVVDHHELSKQGAPPADAFLNPLRPECRYPFKGLASVGVAFTLARGLAKEGDPASVWEHLDLTALGTVADMAPLLGENRILVKAGLHRMSGSAKPGIQALLTSARLKKGETPTSEDVSFSLGPRLNALGRVGSPVDALKLLLTQDRREALSLAKRMNEGNRLRGELERQAVRRALAKVEREVNFNEDRVIVLEDERWHPGVLGIVATRISRQFLRPCVVIAWDERRGRGSARSILGFDIVEALEAVREHLVEFGGHPQAAGLTIDREKFPAFRQSLNRLALKRIEPKILNQEILLDAELPLGRLTPELLRDLVTLAPFGAGNPAPLFLAEDGRLKGAPVWRGRQGIQLTLEDPEGRLIEAWHSRRDGQGDGWRVLLKEEPAGLVYSPICRGGGKPDARLQIRLKEIRRPEAAGRP